MCLSLSLLICNVELMVRPAKPTWQSCRKSKILLGIEVQLSSLLFPQFETHVTSFLVPLPLSTETQTPWQCFHSTGKALSAPLGVVYRARMLSLKQSCSSVIPSPSTVPNTDTQRAARWLWTVGHRVFILISRSLQTSMLGRSCAGRDGGSYRGEVVMTSSGRSECFLRK